MCGPLTLLFERHPENGKYYNQRRKSIVKTKHSERYGDFHREKGLMIAKVQYLPSSVPSPAF